MTSSLTFAVFAVVVSAIVCFDAHWYRPRYSRGRIYLAGLISLTSTSAGDGRAKPAPDVLQAVYMALDDVNRNPGVLPYHDLYLLWNDTQVCNSVTLYRCIVAFRPRQMHGMRTIATDGPVAWCVCLFVCQVCYAPPPCNNGCTDRGPVLGEDSWESMNIVLDEGPNFSPTDSMRHSPIYCGYLFLYLSEKLINVSNIFIFASAQVSRAKYCTYI